MSPAVLPAQFDAGLDGLGLLRSWPSTDPVDLEARLAELRGDAAARESRALEVLDVDEGYRGWSATYDTRVNQLLLAEQPAVTEVLAAIPPGLALDAACGTGRLTGLLLGLGHRVIGVDASEAMLARARRELPAAEFRLGALAALPAADASFDLVTCGLALTHLAALGLAVRELARVLRPGGRLVVSDIHPVSVVLGGHAFFRREDGSRCVIRNLTHWHAEYLDAFAAGGLRVRRCLEPPYTPEIVSSFLREGTSPAIRHLEGLPFALVWDLELPTEGRG
ncbi:MAG: class I SAM-dependent methyltransferase [Candidatus Dormibacteria bacterium]